MLSMETCVSPDGTVSYYDDKITCASMGLDKYHWQPEPFRHLWMWLQTPGGDIIAMMVICTVLVVVLDAKQWFGRAKNGADHTV